MKEETKKELNEETNEQQPTLLLSIIAFPNGGYQVERNICPELIGMLVMELEIAKTVLLQQAIKPPIEPVLQEDTSKGDGH